MIENRMIGNSGDDASSSSCSSFFLYLSFFRFSSSFNSKSQFSILVKNFSICQNSFFFVFDFLDKETKFKIKISFFLAFDFSFYVKGRRRRTRENMEGKTYIKKHHAKRQRETEIERIIRKRQKV